MDTSTYSSVSETFSSSSSSAPSKVQEKSSIRTLMEHSSGQKTEESLEEEVMKVESMCVNCQKNGTTILFLHKIPQFQQVIVSSFECPFCGFANNDVKTAGEISSKGCEITLTIKNKKDFDRMVAKSDYATFKLVEFDFEIPAATQKGKCSTVEGILFKSVEDLKVTIKEYEEKINELTEQGKTLTDTQQNEKKTCEEEKQNIQKFVQNLQGFVEKLEGALKGNQFPLTVKIDDPSGTSFIQSKAGLRLDSQIQTRFYKRTKEQTEAMGFYGVLDEEGKEDTASAAATEKPKFGADIPDNLRCYRWDLNASVEENLQRREEEKKRGLEEETIVFKVECSHCGALACNNICEVDIPGFRKCLLMSFVCDACGARDVEVKPAGSYGEKARRWELLVEGKDDLNRDVLKSDVAGISVPTIEFEMLPGTLGGVFTSVEGLLLKAADSLLQSNPFSIGDSAEKQEKSVLLTIVEKLKALAEDPAQLPFTLVLDDAADQSFIGRRYTALESDTPDPNLKSIVYERTPEQNEDLGLSDMKVENY